MRGYQIVRSIVHTLPKSRGDSTPDFALLSLYWSCYFSLEPGNRSVEVTFKGVFPALVLTFHPACPEWSHTLLSDFSVVMNGSLETLNLGVQSSPCCCCCWHLWTGLCRDVCFHFFGVNIYRSGIAGSYGRYKFNFLRNSQVIFLSDCTIFTF